MNAVQVGVLPRNRRLGTYTDETNFTSPVYTDFSELRKSINIFGFSRVIGANRHPFRRSCSDLTFVVRKRL